MFSYIKFILILFFISVFQFAFLNNIKYVHIDLIFIGLVFFVIFFDIRKSIIAVFFFGVFRDIISSNIFGLYLFVYLIIFSFIYNWESKFGSDTVINQVFMVFVSFLFFKILHIIFLYLFNSANFVLLLPYDRFLINIFCTSFFSPLVFFMLKKYKIKKYESKNKSY